jgi:4-alpha-glucanotransferase
MSDVKNLDRLADLAGIEPFFWDIWGNYYETSEETKRSILSSLGIKANDDAAVEASLLALEEEPWRRALPPVLVIREEEALRIPVTLPVDATIEQTKWAIIEEGGKQCEGLFRPADAPLLEVRQIDGCAMEQRCLELPLALPAGYHNFSLPGRKGSEVMSLIVAPPRCYLPTSLSTGGRHWGIATQLYALRSHTNWGIGDLTDLGDLLEKAAPLGAASVGINPLHALFPEDPGLAAPYMPSSQLRLNPLYLDIVVIPDLAECKAARELIGSDDFTTELAQAQSADLIDYPTVASLKGRVLELLHQSFRHTHLAAGTHRAASFVRFQEAGGESLRRFALCQALTESLGHRRWTEWPEAYRDPSSESVAQFICDNHERLEFCEYLQWQTDQQFAMTCRRAEMAGMAIGIYRDLAVSVAPDGADAWAEQEVVVRKGRIGAPADPFSPLGQDWGSAPLHPQELHRTAYEHFIAVLRANMRHAGALRLDHAMGLQRMFWIPAGAFPESGAYVRYPFEDLLGILALESQRNGCVVVGEDLGTVPEGFRERMSEAGVLSYRVLYFEKEPDRFKRPEEYPKVALACASTHDLPTLQGFIEGNDLEQRFRHGLYRSEAARRDEEAARIRDRQLLLQALEAEGLLPEGTNLDHPEEAGIRRAIIDAVHVYLARSPAYLFMAQIDDLIGESEQINLPGTVFERPNWRRKLSRDLNYLAAETPLRTLADAMKAAQRGN